VGSGNLLRALFFFCVELGFHFRMGNGEYLFESHLKSIVLTFLLFLHTYLWFTFALATESPVYV
jgi:hypothetical protein